MSNALHQAARFSIIAVVIGFAPAASAIGRGGTPTLDPQAALGHVASRATVQLAAETAAPDALGQFVAETVAAHRRKAEDRRVGKLIEAEAEKLRPGQFVWRPELGNDGPVDVVVSLGAQRAYIFRDRRLVAVSSVSSGRRGNRTPTGTFPILQKKREHFSNIYDNAPMPNMQRMTWDGVALHAGAIPGYAASHGCVRLPMAFSDRLYGLTRIGSVVHVVADIPASESAALAHAEAAQAAREAAERARPARGSSGRSRTR